MGGESNPENQTRAEILRHAATLFAQRGYDAVSVREIVQAAGCTKPALYYHFGSKQGVALALFNEFKQAALQARGRAFAESKTPGDAFVYYAREMLSLAKPFRDTLAFGFSIWFGRTSLKELVAEVEETDKQACTAWSNELVRLGLPPAVAVTATRSFWALLLHELMQMVAQPGLERDVDGLSQQIATVVLHGVSALEHSEIGEKRT